MMAVAIETKPAFRAGKPAVLFEGKFSNSHFGLPQYDVAPDGKHFVMLQDVTWPTRIHVVLNWFEELKERVPAAKH